jgi:mycothiol synthase
VGGFRLTDTLVVRPARAGDAVPVVDLFAAADIHDVGEPDLDLDWLRAEWRYLDLARDSWLAFHGDRLVGYASLDRRWREQPEVWLVVHPEHRGRGIGRQLLDLAEARAVATLADVPDGRRVELRSYVNVASQVAASWARRRGYESVRRSWRMRIDMTEPPPAPKLPEPIRIRPFVRERDERATWAAVDEAFRDHWGSRPIPFELWRKRIDADQFDPSLWLLAVDGDEIAGTSLCERYLDMGWIGSLAVRRAWRRRGLGMALLLHSFGEFWRRGRRTVALGVDSENITGATRLYERAGMRVDRAHDLYVKVLRPGA